MKPCSECEGEGTVNHCEACDGSGECLDCDCGRAHECGHCGGSGEGDKTEACPECAGCGSEEALSEWAAKESAAHLPASVQKALCEAVLTSHASMHWRGGTLVTRGLPRSVLDLVPGHRMETRDGVNIEVFAPRPDPEWIKRTLARVQKEMDQ